MSGICPICNSALDEGQRSCPVCGYHVLDSTQSFTPVKIGDAAVPSAQEIVTNHEYDMKIVRGPQTGVEIALHEGKLSIGRDPRCDVFLNDMTVSRLHAEIEVKGDGCVLRDNNSFNGVWVNDRSVETCLLKSGDLIQIGAFCLLYRERAV